MTDEEWNGRLSDLRMLQAAGDDSRVVTTATHLLTLADGPGDVMLEIHAIRLDAVRRLGRDEDALRYAARLAIEFPERAEIAQIALITPLVRLGRIEEANALFAEASSRAAATGDERRASQLYFERGANELASGDLDGGLRSLLTCIQLDPEPKTGAPFQNIASVLAKRSESLDAAEAFAVAAVMVEPATLRPSLATLVRRPTLESAQAHSLLSDFGVRLLASVDDQQRFEVVRSRMALAWDLASRPISLGGSDFKKRRDERSAYVDKSMFAASLIAESANVVLVTAPRRFGKSLNLSTLRYFLDHRAPPSLFDGLAVSQDATAMRHHRACCVVWLPLLSVKPTDVADLRERLAAEIRVVATDLDSDLSATVHDGFERDLLRSFQARTARPLDVTLALRYLTTWLARSERPVWILIDEYDAALERIAGTPEQGPVLDLLRDFLSAGLKDNAALTKGVLTGVTRVTRDSLFSGLNNVVTHPLHMGHLGAWLGFDRSDVHLLTNARGLAEHRGVLKKWYDGYHSGGTHVYNPWSVLRYLDDAARESPDFIPESYWTSTGDPRLIQQSFERHADDLRPGLVALLQWNVIERHVDDSVSLGDLDASSDSFWPLMLYTGYLTATGPAHGRMRLSVPNREVHRALSLLAAPWVTAQFGGQSRLDAFAHALLTGDADVVETMLSAVLLRSVSHHDVTKAHENSYHMLFLGALAWVDGGNYRVTSNTEAGHGRLDLMLSAVRPGHSAAIIELKAARSEDELTARAQEALEQIDERRYAEGLAGGASPVWHFGVSAYRKHVRVLVARRPLDVTTPG